MVSLLKNTSIHILGKTNMLLVFPNRMISSCELLPGLTLLSLEAKVPLIQKRIGETTFSTGDVQRIGDYDRESNMLMISVVLDVWHPLSLFDYIFSTSSTSEELSSLDNPESGVGMIHSGFYILTSGS